MQDSNPQADGNAEARSHDEWRSDRSADTVLRDGARIPTPADGAGAGERVGRGGVGEGGGEGGGGGGGGLFFFAGSPPTGPAPTPKDAPPDQTNECAEPGVTPSRYRNRAKLSAPPRQSSPRERLPRALEPKGFPAKRTADRPWDTPGIPPSSPASFRVKLALLDAKTDTRLSMRTRSPPRATR